MNYPEHYIWVLIPLFGMGLGGFFVWLSHQRQKQSLDILKSYVDKGAEPPPSVLEALSAAHMAKSWQRPPPNRNPWPRFALFAVLALGFAGGAVWAGFDCQVRWPGGLVGFVIPAVIFAAFAASALASALTRGRDDR